MMTERKVNAHTPGHAEYVGMTGEGHRVYHVTSGPDLLPPIPYTRLIAAAPRMLAWMKARICYDQTCGDESCHEARAILRDVEGESNG